MIFETIARVFPKEEKYWPCMAPAKALPIFLRAFMREKFGGVFAANDIFKRNTPSRMGISIKPFEIGDPIATVSRNHFIKTTELLTKVDYAAGRQKVVVIFHNYSNMTYQSEHTTTNKGQLANTVLGILEEAHKGQSHYFKVLAVTDSDLFVGCELYKKDLQHSEYVYFITDLLFDNADHFAAANTAVKILNTFHIKKAIFIVTRDPLEYTDIKNNIEELVPWTKKSDSAKYHFFSGEEYLKNLSSQINFLKSIISQNNHLIKIVTANDHVLDFINFILLDIFRKK